MALATKDWISIAILIILLITIIILAVFMYKYKTASDECTKRYSCQCNHDMLKLSKTNPTNWTKNDKNDVLKFFEKGVRGIKIGTNDPTKVSNNTLHSLLDRSCHGC